MLWHEWGIRECAAKQERGIKVKSREEAAEREQRGLEELRQLNHEDRRASAEMFRRRKKKVGGKDWKAHRAREENRSLKSKEKVGYCVQLGSHHRLKS